MRFFFYGTLLAGSANPVAAEIHAKLAPLGMANARGLLHAIPDPLGWFTALVEGDGTVRGMVYEAGESFGAADLARMDAYEDFDPADPDSSLYLRHALPVRLDGGPAGDAQVYVWNRPLPDASRPIPGGDFRAWLAAEGADQFSGLREA
ncbi:MAG: gamma-glutamylcyclotransferase [Sphingomonadales bacterium]|nr:gamma-glutamylcyclotransferase [Sphingomonadales bacterium]MDE2569167.1 gamma-glutamylcyclotransferase [Sphingomonadales bacterium]